MVIHTLEETILLAISICYDYYTGRKVGVLIMQRRGVVK